jgi:hypothetical protein
MPKSKHYKDIYTLEAQLEEQTTNIARCGATLAGYIAKYGEKGEERCLGEGGRAIYEADQNALRMLLDRMRMLNPRSPWLDPGVIAVKTGRRKSGPELLSKVFRLR